MKTDPILDLFWLVAFRLLMFIMLSLLLGLAVWYWLLTTQFDVSFADLLNWLRAAWSPVESKVPAVFFYGSLIIGTLATSVFYLLIGCWWKKRARVPHHRGAHLDDREA